MTHSSFACKRLLKHLSLLAATGTLAMALTACHSPFVQTSITNLGPPIHTLEIDYPSQSFGVQQLATNQTFKYRFKVQGSGPIKLQYFDPAGKAHSSTGPELAENEEGSITILLTAAGQTEWRPGLETPKK